MKGEKHQKSYEVKKIFSKIKRNNNYKSNNEIDDILQEKLDNIYNRDWGKLEPGFQKNRINFFIKEEVLKKKILESNINNLRSLLFSAAKKKILNNKTVNYNIEKGVIESISILKYNEEKKIYSIDKTKSKPKKKKKKVVVKKKDTNLINKYAKKHNDYKESLVQEKINTQQYIDTLTH